MLLSKTKPLFRGICATKSAELFPKTKILTNTYHKSCTLLDSDFYETLGISKSADSNEIKKAYRKLAAKYHPDMTGNDEKLTAKFREVTEAYEVLSDEKKVYDTYGKSGIENEGFGDPFDIYNNFWGGAGFGQQRGPEKTPDKQINVLINLEDIYNQATKKIAVKLRRNCKTCEGTGSKSGKSEECIICKGSGTQLETRQVGPMIQQMIVTCRTCGGTGRTIPTHDKCGTCHGERIIVQSEPFDINLTGFPNRIILEGEAEDDLKIEKRGDLILNIQVKKHPIFTVNEYDLELKKQISLVEALTGVDFEIDFFNNRKLRIKSPPNDIIKENQKKSVKGMGLPTNVPGEFGDLHITFTIKYPESLDNEQKEKLIQILAYEKEKSTPSEGAEELSLSNTIIKHKKPQERSRSSEQGGGTQCRTQ